MRTCRFHQMQASRNTAPIAYEYKNAEENGLCILQIQDAYLSEENEKKDCHIGRYQGGTA